MKFPEATNTEQKIKKVAVFFGGRSPEHDVSVITGLQVLSAIDETLYEAFPVYIDPEGEWRISKPAKGEGEVLRKRENYLLRGEALEQTQIVTLDLQAERGGRLIPKEQKFFGKPKPILFDIALPCFHGLYGEDGNIQGLFELANIPYAGMRIMASSILMDKAVTKKILEAIDVPVLPYAVLKRPQDSYVIPEDDIKETLKGLKFPCIIKPVHLGSSIGVAKVNSLEEVKATLPAIFEFDDSAILEPFVENLVEYNVAVSRLFGGQELSFSAIERPKTTEELLDFKQKYMAGDNGKTGGLKMNDNASEDAGSLKQPGAGAISEGMLSLTRELNPDLKKKQIEDIKAYAAAMFEAVNGTGAPRIDFIGDAKTGKIWLNEVNPIPGSFGYFLWEAAQDSKLFTELLTALLQEAVAENVKRSIPKDPVPEAARLLKRA